MLRNRFAYIPFALLIVGLMVACKSNTSMNRGIAGLTTRYNIHFNGEELYKEALTTMEENSQENFNSSLEFLHPIHAKKNEKEPNNTFNGAIEKCKKCIQTKSITQKPRNSTKKNSPEYKKWLTRTEYNPYMHNAWLLSGRCQFYNGDFNAAEATYHFTSQKFWWKPTVQAECHIWQARSQAIQGYYVDAETNLDLALPQKQYKDIEHLKKNPIFSKWPRKLQQEFCLAKAEIMLGQTQHRKEAIPYLLFSQDYFISKKQRIRTQFFIAQLYEEQALYAEAEKIYQNIARRANNYSTKVNARLSAIHAESLAQNSNNVSNNKRFYKLERKLIHLLRQARNKEYMGQIYAALADVSMLRKDTIQAIKNYTTAIEKFKTDGIEKAKIALRLGDISFKQRDYAQAQKAYSLVISLIDRDFERYEQIRYLSSVLDELQIHAETIHLQDSLLYIASLDERMRNQVIDNIIEEYRRQEKKDQKNRLLAEYNEIKGQNVDPLAQNNIQPMIESQNKSWYFYNPAVISKGKSEFVKQWGARKPEDNWRRKNKSETPTLSKIDENPSYEQRDTSEEFEKNSISTDPYSRDFYLAQIPITPNQKEQAHQLIEEALYCEGVIINEKLENFPLAIQTFQEMEKRYPESAHLLDSYYACYLMCMRLENKKEAEIWRRKLLNKFPSSAYAEALLDTNYIEKLRDMARLQDSLYISTYRQFQQTKVDSVHQAYYYVKNNWPLSPLLPKFSFLHALSYVQEGDAGQFQEALEQLTATHPNSDVSPLASLMIKGLHEGKKMQAGRMQSNTTLWKTSLKKESDSTATDSLSKFIDNDDVPHLLLLSFNKDSINANDLLFEVAKFNFENFLTRDFDLEIIDTQSGLRMIIVSGFDNLDMLLDYHDRMEATTNMHLTTGLYMIDISDQNFRLLLKGKTFDEYFEWIKTTYGLEEISTE